MRKRRKQANSAVRRMKGDMTVRLIHVELPEEKRPAADHAWALLLGRADKTVLDPIATPSEKKPA